MSRSNSIQRLLDLLKVLESLQTTASFSSLLRLSHSDLSSLSVDQLTFEKPTLKLQLPLSNKIHLPNQTNVALSTYLAMIDDLTTWSLALSDPSRQRAGASVSLQAEWGPAAFECKPGDVEISATADKVGKNLGFASAQVRHHESGDLILFAKHIKYLPGGMVFDFLSSSTGWPLLQLLSSVRTTTTSSSEVDENNQNAEKSLAEAFESLQVSPEEGSASIKSSWYHANPMGNIHGGCHAILMELLAAEVAKSRLDCSLVTLESMQVEYHSPAKSDKLELQAETIKQSADSLTLRVKLICRNRAASVGILTLAPSTSVPSPSEKSRL